MIWSICAFRVLNPRQWSLVKVISNDQNDIVGYLVGCFEDLRRFSVFHPYRDMEAGDTQSLKS